MNTNTYEEPTDEVVAQRLYTKLKETEDKLKHVIAGFNAYIKFDNEWAERNATFPVSHSESFEVILRDLRDRKIDGLDMPEHLKLKKFLVTYNVNLVHEFEVEAGDEIEARMVFEEIYENEQEVLPEYHDISHEIVDVEYVMKEGNE
jgi:hypothetical protein